MGARSCKIIANFFISTYSEIGFLVPQVRQFPPKNRQISRSPLNKINDLAEKAAQPCSDTSCS